MQTRFAALPRKSHCFSHYKHAASRLLVSEPCIAYLQQFIFARYQPLKLGVHHARVLPEMHFFASAAICDKLLGAPCAYLRGLSATLVQIKQVRSILL